MSRELTNAELWEKITVAGILRDVDPAVATTLSASVAKDATTFDVTSATSLAVGDWLRIDSGNKSEFVLIKTIATTTITPVSKIAIAHDSGAAVSKVEKVKIGEVTTEGVKRNTTLDQNKYATATTRGTFATIVRGIDHTMEWNTPNHSIENIALSLGIPESNIVGTGIATDPYRLAITEDVVNTAINHAFYFQGALHDGTVFEIQAWGIDFDGTAEVTYTSGDPAAIRIAGNSKTIVYYTPAPAAA